MKNMLDPLNEFSDTNKNGLYLLKRLHPPPKPQNSNFQKCTFMSTPLSAY